MLLSPPLVGGDEGEGELSFLRPPSPWPSLIKGEGRFWVLIFGLIEMRLSDLDKGLSWSPADRATHRCCLFNRIAANRANIIIRDFVFPEVLQGF
jgi:hypothetical protein